MSWNGFIRFSQIVVEILDESPRRTVHERKRKWGIVFVLGGHLRVHEVSLANNKSKRLCQGGGGAPARFPGRGCFRVTSGNR